MLNHRCQTDDSRTFHVTSEICGGGSMTEFVYLIKAAGCYVGLINEIRKVNTVLPPFPAPLPLWVIHIYHQRGLSWRMLRVIYETCHTYDVGPNLERQIAGLLWENRNSNRDVSSFQPGLNLLTCTWKVDALQLRRHQKNLATPTLFYRL